MVISATTNPVANIAPCMEDVLGLALQSGQPGIVSFSAGERIGLQSRYLVLSYGCETTHEIPSTQASPNLISTLNTLLPPANHADSPFRGLAGFISYEAGHHFEPAMNQRANHSWPLLRFVDVDACYVLDQLNQTASIYFTSEASGSRRAEFADWITSLTELSPVARNAPISEPPENFEQYGELSRTDYANRITEILNDIARGEYYECNFTQRFRIRSQAAPVDVAQKFLAANPAPHTAFMDFGDFAIISASPELFLRRSSDTIETRPIKGSAPRGATTESDSAQSSRLNASPKDAAEHTMVIDVARNDLGRICHFGTVKTSNPFDLETFPTIHHLVSTVEGKLTEGVGLGDILAAAFPPASITGAPKIKVTEAIARYEASPRGIYTGAIGHIQTNGDFQFNVAIRTIIATRSGPGEWLYEIGAGGAIVADSNPNAEYDECLFKAIPALAAIANAPEIRVH